MEKEILKLILQDGELLREKNPGTFQIPDSIIRHNLPVGATVKIAIPGERFWVKVVRVEEPGKRYVGKIDNDLVMLPEALGALVHFEPRHVLAIWED